MGDEARTGSVPPADKAKLAIVALVLGTLTDWLGILVMGAMIHLGTLPVDPFAYIMAALAGGTVINKARGKSGGSTTAAIAIGLAKVGAAGIAKKLLMLAPLVMIVGCGAASALLPVAEEAMRALLPAAKDALVREAERRDDDMDANEAICFEAPEEYQPDDYLLVMCVAPVRDDE